MRSATQSFRPRSSGYSERPHNAADAWTAIRSTGNPLDGSLGVQRSSRHYTEWLKFLKQLDRETSKDKALHLIVDNYATHKHPTVQKWLSTGNSRLSSKQNATLH